jgi:hypothetical protein
MLARPMNGAATAVADGNPLFSLIYDARTCTLLDTGEI